MDWPSPFSSSIGHNAIQLRRIKRKKKAEHLCKNVRYILKLTRVKNRGWHVGTKTIFLIPNMVLAIFLLRVMFVGIYVIKESKKRGQCNSWAAICVHGEDAVLFVRCHVYKVHHHSETRYRHHHLQGYHPKLHSLRLHRRLKEGRSELSYL